MKRGTFLVAVVLSWLFLGIAVADFFFFDSDWTIGDAVLEGVLAVCAVALHTVATISRARFIRRQQSLYRDGDVL